MSPGAFGNIGSKFLHIIRTGPRVKRFGNVRLFLNINLSISSNTRREIGRKRNSFVKCICMERLSVSQYCSHCLDARSCHIVVWILFCERPSGSLRVSSQRKRLRIFRVELINQFCPNHTGSAHLGNFHKMVHPNCPKERETGSKLIHVHSCCYSCSKVFKPVCQSVCHFDIACRTCFLHMVSGNRDRVELRHILRGKRENISNNPH